MCWKLRNSEIQRELRKEKLSIDGILPPFPEDLSISFFNCKSETWLLNWIKLVAAGWHARSQYFTDVTMTDIETYSFKNIVRTSAKKGKNLYESRHVPILNTIIYLTARSFVTFREYYRKQESEKSVQCVTSLDRNHVEKVLDIDHFQPAFLIQSDFNKLQCVYWPWNAFCEVFFFNSWTFSDPVWSFPTNVSSYLRLHLKTAV